VATRKQGAPARQPAAKKDAPAAPRATPLFTNADGKAVQGATAVLQVVDRYGPESGELDSLPRRLELLALLPTSSGSEAAASARATGLLPEGADCVVVNARYCSRVDAPRAEVPEPPAEAGS
jgi:hypothetical protein